MAEMTVDHASASRPGGGRAVYSAAAWARFAVPAVAGLVVDLWTKAASFPGGIEGEGLHPARFHHEAQEIVPGVLGFTTTINKGAVFGIGQGMSWLFVVFSIVAMAAIMFVFTRSFRSQWVLHVALGLITAGAIGNLYDRVVYGGVRDMLKFEVDWYPYIFNIADVLLCIGVPLLMAVWLFTKDPGEVAAKGS